jgi:hypothetical protein
MVMYLQRAIYLSKLMASHLVVTPTKEAFVSEELTYELLLQYANVFVIILRKR